MENLKDIALPSTVSTIEKDAFKANPNLHWVDLSACDSLKSSIDTLGISADALVYMPSTYNTEGQTNVVYGTDGSLQCDDYYLTVNHDYNVPKAFTAKKVTLGREYQKNKYITTTLPFSTTTLPTGFRAYALNTDLSKNGEINFKATKSMNANVPYVVKAKKTTNLVVDEAVTVPVTPLHNTSVGDQYYALFGNLQTISGKDAHDRSMLAMNDSTRLWNIISADADGLEPYTAYVQKKTNDASTTDVQGVFSTWHYYVGDTRYDLDGDNTEESPLCCDLLKIEDGKDFKADDDVSSFTADSATYIRDMSTTWGTLCLPFAYSADENKTCEFYQMKDNTATSIVLTKLKGTILAGTPVVVRRRDNRKSIEISPCNEVPVTTKEAVSTNMTGSFCETGVPSVPTGTYIIKNNKFWLVDPDKYPNGAKIKPYHGYITTNGSKAAVMGLIVDGETTGIDQLNNLDNDAKAEYYDAEGRRTNGLQKGLNIVKTGKRVVKVMIK